MRRRRLEAHQEDPTCKKRALIYARLSDEDRNQASLDIQVEQCEQWATTHGLEVFAVIRDEDCSATKSALKRPVFLEMIEKAKREADYVLVWKTDRFCRNEEDSIHYSFLLAKSGVELQAVLEPTDNSPLGQFSRSVFRSLAQLEPRVMSQRIKAKFRKMEERGYWLGGPAPFGYRIQRTQNPDAAILVLGPEEERELVRRIFSSVQRTGLVTIAEQLNDEGRAGIRGRRWSVGTLNAMVKNPTYTGVYRRGMSESGERLEIIRHKEPSIWREDHWPRIVSEEEWNAANAAIDGRARNRPLHSRPRGDGLLSYLLHCECSGRLYKTNQSYRCRRKARGLGYIACDSRNLSARKIDQMVIGAVREASGKLLKQLESDMAQPAPVIGSVTSEIRGLEERISRCLENIEMGIEPDIMRRRVRELRTQLNLLLDETAREKERRERDEKLKSIHRLCREKLTLLQGGVEPTQSQWREVICAFVHSIEVLGKGTRLRVNFALGGEIPEGPEKAYMHKKIHGCFSALRKRNVVCMEMRSGIALIRAEECFLSPHPPPGRQ